jgi:propionyl-CoA carboxylase alpha chain
VAREQLRSVWLDRAEIRLEVAREHGGIGVRLLGETDRGPVVLLSSAWKPGDPVWQGTIDGAPVAVQVRPILNGFRLFHGGLEARAFVYTESESAAARLMPAKVAPDTGKKLVCPMPGLVVLIAVAVGQEVKAGETLAVVEAMKMENVLRAERDGVVKAIFAKKGDSLAVDAVILEFE